MLDISKKQDNLASCWNLIHNAVDKEVCVDCVGHRLCLGTDREEGSGKSVKNVDPCIF
jgi:hypothetical protein